MGAAVSVLLALMATIDFLSISEHEPVILTPKKKYFTVDIIVICILFYLTVICIDLMMVCIFLTELYPLVTVIFAYARVLPFHLISQHIFF